VSSEITYPATTAFTRFQKWDFGGHRRFSDFWTAEIEKDPCLRQLVMTFDLVFGIDGIARVASDNVVVTSGTDSEERTYLAAIQQEPEITFSYTLGQSSASGRSLTLSVPTALVNPRSLISQGRLLAGFGEVALQVDGGDLDERFPLLIGDMDDGVTFNYDPDDDNQSDFVEFAISDPVITADRGLPPWVLDSDRWEDIHDSAVGERCQIILGGYDYVPLVPVDTIGNSEWLVGYGHNMTVSTVYVNGTSVSAGDATYGWSVDEKTDFFDLPVTVIRFTGSWSPSTEDFNEGVHVTVSTTSDADNLIDTIETLLLDYSPLGRRMVDMEAIALARAKLGNLRTYVMINGSSGGESTTVFDFIENGLLSSFPMVSMAWTGSGYGPIVTDRRDGRIALKLEPGSYPCISRASAVSESARADLFNDFTLRYGYDLLNDTWTGVVTRNPDNSDLCRLSRELIGGRAVHDVIEAPYIKDESVAEYVIDWLVEHMGFPTYEVTYVCYPSVLFWLRLGDNIEVVDDHFGWTDETGTVEEIKYSRGAVLVKVRVWLRYYELSGGSRAYGGYQTFPAQ